MFEFILKDDYAWDGYDYLVRIYVEDKEEFKKALENFIFVVRNNNEVFDDSTINYIRKYLETHCIKYEMKLLQDMEKISY